MMIQETLFKLTYALILGFFIGLDRQMKHKPLGMKTSMIMSVSSALITIVSIQAFHTFATPVFRTMDPMRLAAQIVSGVGFLGAGVILQRRNDVISGLTSAALIWSAAGIGIAVAVGLYAEATFATLLFIVAVNVIPYFVKRLGPDPLRQDEMAVKLFTKKDVPLTELIQTIEGKTITLHSLTNVRAEPIEVRRFSIKDLNEEEQLIELRLMAPESQHTTEIYYMFKKMDSIARVEIERL